MKKRLMMLVLAGMLVFSQAGTASAAGKNTVPVEEDTEAEVEETTEEEFAKKSSAAETISIDEAGNAYDTSEGKSAADEVTSSASVQNSKSGVMQINTMLGEGSGKQHLVCGGACFLIGTPGGSDSASQYVITNYHLINPGTEEIDRAKEYYGIEAKENGSEGEPEISYEVTIEKDVTISATLVTKSEEMDLAVLQLSQVVFNRTPLKISSDSKDIESTKSVYALGFPAELDMELNHVNYSVGDVAISTGTVSNIVTNKMKFIQHTARVSEANCGGPLLNADGAVIGMNVLTDSSGNYFYSLEAAEFTKLLDALGIVYEKYVPAEPATEEAQEVDTKEDKKDNGIFGISKTVFIIFCAIAALLLLVIIVLIVLLVKSGNSGEKKEKKPFFKKKKKAKEVSPQVKNLQNLVTEEPDGNETNVLMPEPGDETAVLGGSSVQVAVATGTLIRRRSGENIVISRKIFRIGKDSLHVDYCINDNSSVSRTHAALKSKGDGVYIEDMHSTNGTFLNGSRVNPGEERRIKDGDIIRIANEEFEFRNA
ncbi:FHA domain-containing protein [Lachnospiraceae bacterium]|nr:FHA domain-containing protein [Lachnospiraceae bacterium]